MELDGVLAVLLLAAALALQPWSVIAAIVMASSHRGVAKVTAFVAGWVAALLAVAAGTVALQPAIPRTSSAGPALGLVEVVLGVGLLLWLLRRLRRPEGGGSRSPDHGPAWLERADSMPPVAAAALGAFLPNYVFVVAAVSEVLRTGRSGAALVWTCLAFVLTASLGVAAPLGVLAVRREHAPETYATWRQWLQQHAATVLGTVGVLVGAMLVLRGAAALASARG